MVNFIVVAVSSPLPFFLISLLVSNVVVPIHAGVATASANDAVSDICNQNPDPPFCFTVMKPATTTDLIGLVLFTFNVSRTRAVDNLLLARSLKSKAVDPELKARYTACAVNFNKTIGSLDLARKNLYTSYDGVNINVVDALNDLDACYKSFMFPPTDPSPLSKNAQDLEYIVNIFLEIPYILPGGGGSKD